MLLILLLLHEISDTPTHLVFILKIVKFNIAAHLGSFTFLFIRKLIFQMEEEQSSSLFPYYSQWNEQRTPYQPPQIHPSPPTSQSQQDLQALPQAKERFLHFAMELKQQRNSPIRSDVFLYAASGFRKQKIRQELFDYGLIVHNIECRIQKMKKTRKIKKNWGEEDLKILVWIISKYCSIRNIENPQKQLETTDWNFIASLIPGVNAESCMFKWLGLKKVTLANNNWTSRQSALLRQLVAKRKEVNPKHCSEIKDWKDISQELYSMNDDSQKCYRNAKQCREHWTCYLSPKLKKGPWNLSQDLKLFQFIYSNRGGKRWSQIAKEFNGRTQNALKNRYTLLIEKQRKIHRKSTSQLQLIKDFLDKSQVNQLMQSEYQSVSEFHQQEKTFKQQPYYAQIKEESNQGFQIKVERMDLQTFQTFSYDFWRSLQPGIIQPNGQFTKINHKHTEPSINITPQASNPSQQSPSPSSYSSQEQLSNNSLLSKHSK